MKQAEDFNDVSCKVTPLLELFMKIITVKILTAFLRSLQRKVLIQMNNNFNKLNCFIIFLFKSYYFFVLYLKGYWLPGRKSSDQNIMSGPFILCCFKIPYRHVCSQTSSKSLFTLSQSQWNVEPKWMYWDVIMGKIESIIHYIMNLVRNDKDLICYLCWCGFEGFLPS